MKITNFVKKIWWHYINKTEQVHLICTTMLFGSNYYDTENVQEIYMYIQDLLAALLHSAEQHVIIIVQNKTNTNNPQKKS